MTVINRLTETEVLQRKIRNAIFWASVFMVVGITSSFGRFYTNGVIGTLLVLIAILSTVLTSFFALSAWAKLEKFVQFRFLERVTDAHKSVGCPFFLQKNIHITLSVRSYWQGYLLKKIFQYSIEYWNIVHNTYLWFLTFIWKDWIVESPRSGVYQIWLW